MSDEPEITAQSSSELPIWFKDGAPEPLETSDSENTVVRDDSSGDEESLAQDGGVAEEVVVPEPELNLEEPVSVESDGDNSVVRAKCDVVLKSLKSLEAVSVLDEHKSVVEILVKEARKLVTELEEELPL